MKHCQSILTLTKLSMQGLQLAKKEACKFIKDNIAIKVETLGKGTSV